MENKIKATIDITPEELKKILRKHFCKGDLSDFKLVGVVDKNIVKEIPGGDSGSVNYFHIFDGLTVEFEK